MKSDDVARPSLTLTPPRGGERESSHAGAPLAGVEVLDLTSYIAGSYGFSLLADLGARVTKVESPQGGGDPFRQLAGGFLGWNRGKRGIVVDLQKPEGRDIVHELVRRADVVAENFRPGVPERLGVDYDTLRRLNPRLVYCTVSSFGTGGPLASRPAFDPLLQALAGIVGSQGGPGQPPVYLTVPVCDYTSAMLAAYGTVLALFTRQRTGSGQRVASSLTGAAALAQSWEFAFYPGRPPAHRGGRDFRGYHAGALLYRTRGGWLFLGCETQEEWQRLWDGLAPHGGRWAETPTLAEVADSPAVSSEMQRRLEDVLNERTVDEWLGRLWARGVPVAPVQARSELFRAAQCLANDLYVEHQHPSLGLVRQIGPLIKFSLTPGRSWGPAPEYGQHTDQVLAELGYSPQTIADLRARVVIR